MFDKCVDVSTSEISGMPIARQSMVGELPRMRATGESNLSVTSEIILGEGRGPKLVFFLSVSNTRPVTTTVPVPDLLFPLGKIRAVWKRTGVPVGRRCESL